MKEDIIVIVGPTAIGKTDLSIALALHSKRIEIISGDSVQVYRGMDIGSGKATEAEMQGIPHKMIDILDPDDAFSVADFKRRVHQEITDIHKRGNLPLIVGGSGLYIQAILYDYQFTDQRRNEQLTAQLEQKALEQGNQALYDELIDVDPEQAKMIHPNNVRRVIRALEQYYDTGKKLSDKPKAMEHPLYNHHIIGLTMDRDSLYDRINKRVDQMIENGLVEEVRTLYESYGDNIQAMRAIGYKELIPYIKGNQSLDFAVSQLKQNSRRFAKRQYTWFNNKLDVNWYMVDPNNIGKLQNDVFKDLAMSLQL